MKTYYEVEITLDELRKAGFRIPNARATSVRMRDGNVLFIKLWNDEEHKS